MRPLTPPFVLAVTVAIWAAPLGAQIVRGPAPIEGPDNGARAAVAQSAADVGRRAQGDFEIYRRTHLPKVTSRRAPTCDERVGKYCYWYAEGHELPAEPTDIARQRDKLIRALDSLAGVAPTSIWIAEQRVRYLTESERYTEALKAARSCGGDAMTAGWRCEILVGFALHMKGEYREAEKVYDAAIPKMGALDACAWRDMSLLLDEVAFARYRTSPCGSTARAQFTAQAWHYARTLYSMPGNDSRTEFFARMTMAQMITDAPGAYQKGFNDDERETLLRFGWARSWASEYVLPFSIALGDTSIVPSVPGTSLGVKGKGKGGTPMGSYPPGTKIPASMPPLTRPPDMTKGPLGGSSGAPDNTPQLPKLPGVKAVPRDDDGISVVGMEATPAYRYIPAGFVLNDPVRSDSAAWRPQPPPVIARYAPAYARLLVPLEHQEAMFKRGDSALVVMAYETRGSKGVDGARIDAALVVTTPGEVPKDYIARRDSAPASGTFSVRAPWGPLLMSAEIVAPERHAVARARYGIGPLDKPPERVILSDLLFYRAGEQFPATAEEAAPLALASERVHAKEKLGVFWEAYGTDPAGEKVHVNLIVMREERDGEEGGLTRLLGLAPKRDPTPVSISVDDVSARGSRTSSRAIALDISTLSKGSYVVQLEITVAGQATLRTEHRIEVVGP